MGVGEHVFLDMLGAQGEMLGSIEQQVRVGVGSGRVWRDDVSSGYVLPLPLVAVVRRMVLNNHSPGSVPLGGACRVPPRNFLCTLRRECVGTCVDCMSKPSEYCVSCAISPCCQPKPRPDPFSHAPLCAAAGVLLQVARSVGFVKGGTEALQDAKRLQKNTRKWMCCAIMIMLIVALVIVLAVVRPWRYLK